MFYWLEGGEEQLRIQRQNETYQRERYLLVKRMEEILIDRAIDIGWRTESVKRRRFVEEALDHFHAQLNVKLVNAKQWSLSTAMYYSGKRRIQKPQFF